MSEPVIVFSSEIVDHALADAMCNAGVGILTVEIPPGRVTEKIMEALLLGDGRSLPPPVGLLIDDDPCARTPREPRKYGKPRPYLKRKKGRA